MADTCANSAAGRLHKLFRNAQPMANTTDVEELRAIAAEIEIELEACEKNLKRVGALSVKIQSFCNMVGRMDHGGSAAEELRKKARAYAGRVKALGDRRAREQSEFEQEMADSKLSVRKISEACDPDREVASDKDFYADQTSKLDSFITNTMDSLESLKRQGVYISRVNERLRSGLERLGVSGELIGRIERQYAGDNMLFKVAFAFTVVLVIFLIILLRS